MKSKKAIQQEIYVKIDKMMVYDAYKNYLSLHDFLTGS